MQRALRGEADADVPCRTCTACCRSSQFVHIAPDESDTLAHVPTDLLFPAPGLPDGHVVLGYDENGHCPMLTDTGCSIYEHRPRTCRSYDCRVYAATGLHPDDKPLVAEHVRRWEFSLETDTDCAQIADLRARAATLLERSAASHDDPPRTVTAVAIKAIEAAGDGVAYT
jgi:Fe-S-cluster containining protein